MLILDIADLPTLRQGHFANLKIETPQVRVWLSRMTLADGEVEPISIEKLTDGVWVPFHGDVLLSRNGETYCVRWVHRGAVGSVRNTASREYDSTVYPWE